jgi:hypothetical protein
MKTAILTLARAIVAQKIVDRLTSGDAPSKNRVPSPLTRFLRAIGR